MALYQVASGQLSVNPFAFLDFAALQCIPFLQLSQLETGIEYLEMYYLIFFLNCNYLLFVISFSSNDLKRK